MHRRNGKPEWIDIALGLKAEVRSLKTEYASMLARNGDFRAKVTFAAFGHCDALTDEQIIAGIVRLCGESLALDTPGNTDAVEREVPEVRCFEWVGEMFAGGLFAKIIECVASGNGRAIAFDGSERVNPCWPASDLCNEPDWREFPPSEWDAKVAAIKAAANPEAPAGEWPKWTFNPSDNVVRFWACENASYLHGAPRDDRPWTECDTGTSIAMYASWGNYEITRAQAVALIGEAAVRDGERLAGVKA